MPGQEKMVIDYYQKNPSAAQSLKGSLYEEKIINLIKSKIKLQTKNINNKEAEIIINKFNQANQSDTKKTFFQRNKVKSKKISKK